MKHIETVWEGSERCKSCAIRHLVLFSDLQHDDFEHIHKPIDDLTYAPGTTLYQQHENSHHVYTIRSGLIKLVQHLPDGGCRIVRVLGQGELLGIESLNHQKTEHMAVTLDEVEVCRIPHAVIEQLQQNSPRLHSSLMSRWQSTLSMADLWITKLSTGKIKTRVAHLLLLLAEKSQDENFFLPAREDIGNMLGITTESASKVTAEFKRNGWIGSVANSRSWIDVDALKKI